MTDSLILMFPDKVAGESQPKTLPDMRQCKRAVTDILNERLNVRMRYHKECEVADLDFDKRTAP